MLKFENTYNTSIIWEEDIIIRVGHGDFSNDDDIKLKMSKRYERLLLVLKNLNYKRNSIYIESKCMKVFFLT